MSPRFNKYGEIIPDEQEDIQERVDFNNASPQFNQYGEYIGASSDTNSQYATLDQEQNYDVLINDVITNAFDVALLPIREDNYRTTRNDDNSTLVPVFVIIGVVFVIIALIACFSIAFSNVGSQEEEYLAPVSYTGGESSIVPNNIQEQNPVRPSEPEPLPTAHNPNEEIALIQVVGQDVNLRARPGSEERKLDVIHRGKILILLNDVRIVENNEWRYVRYGGYDGWVNARYIRIIEPQNIPEVRARVVGVLPDTLRVREAPSTEAKIIDRISEYSEVEVLDCTNQGNRTWCLIQIDNTRGWVVQDYLAFL